MAPGVCVLMMSRDSARLRRGVKFCCRDRFKEQRIDETADLTQRLGMEQQDSIVDSQGRRHRMAIGPVQGNGTQAPIGKSDDDPRTAERLLEPHRRQCEPDQRVYGVGDDHRFPRGYLR